MALLTLPAHLNKLLACLELGCQEPSSWNLQENGQIQLTLVWNTKQSGNNHNSSTSSGTPGRPVGPKQKKRKSRSTRRRDKERLSKFLAQKHCHDQNESHIRKQNKETISSINVFTDTSFKSAPLLKTISVQTDQVSFENKARIPALEEELRNTIASLDTCNEKLSRSTEECISEQNRSFKLTKDLEKSISESKTYQKEASDAKREMQAAKSDLYNHMDQIFMLEEELRETKQALGKCNADLTQTTKQYNAEQNRSTKLSKDLDKSVSEFKSCKKELFDAMQTTLNAASHFDSLKDHIEEQASHLDDVYREYNLPKAVDRFGHPLPTLSDILNDSESEERDIPHENDCEISVALLPKHFHKHLLRKNQNSTCNFTVEDNRNSIASTYLEIREHFGLHDTAIPLLNLKINRTIYYVPPHMTFGDVANCLHTAKQIQSPRECKIAFMFQIRP